MGKRKLKVLEADFHRNGMAGNGFRVAIVNDPDVGRALVIDFHEQGQPETYGHTAVLNLDEAAKGNIYMFPTAAHAGHKAWRGDVLGDKFRSLIVEKVGY